MSAGELRHRITLQCQVMSSDEFSDIGTTYRDFGARWAGFRPVSSKELQASCGELMQTDVVFKLRFANDLADMDNTWRVWYQNRRYDVISILNVDFSDRWLLVRCRQYRKNLRVDNINFGDELHEIINRMPENKI